MFNTDSLSLVSFPYSFGKLSELTFTIKAILGVFYLRNSTMNCNIKMNTTVCNFLWPI